jgi:hypothetical protein
MRALRSARDRRRLRRKLGQLNGIRYEVNRTVSPRCMEIPVEPNRQGEKSSRGEKPEKKSSAGKKGQRPQEMRPCVRSQLRLAARMKRFAHKGSARPWSRSNLFQKEVVTNPTLHFVKITSDRQAIGEWRGDSLRDLFAYISGGAPIIGTPNLDYFRSKGWVRQSPVLIDVPLTVLWDNFWHSFRKPFVVRDLQHRGLNSAQRYRKKRNGDQKRKRMARENPTTNLRRKPRVVRRTRGRR